MTRPKRAPPGSEQLAARLGHVFARPWLLHEALTHPSMAGAGPGRTYERLEFLGDRVLGVIVADLLFHRFPDESEGDLARRHSALVRREALFEVAREIGLGSHLMLSKGEAESGGGDNPAILADACEAVIAALFLDGGLEAAARFVTAHWKERMEAEARPPRDAKTALQEWAQGAGKPLPSYRVVSTEGPPHEPVFAVELRVEGVEPVIARGPTKRAAEQAAAAILRDRLAARGGG